MGRAVRTKLLLASLLTVFAIGIIGHHGSVSADVGVSIGVGDTYLNLTGQTSPGAFVTIKDDDQVIGTVSADANGSFSKLLGAQTPGLHTLSIYARSNSGIVTDSSVVNANLREHETTDVFVFLPTTITLAGSDLPPGSELQANGETMPGGALLFYLDQSAPIQVQADTGGVWNLRVGSGQLAAGNHSIIAYVTNGSGQQSSPTVPRFFTILAGESASSPPGSQAATLKPPASPIIILPKNNTAAATNTITLVGVSDAFVQIEVWRNGRLIGSVLTDNHGGWSMPVQLLAGKNDLRARACRSDLCSAFSQISSVAYNPAEEVLNRPFRILLDRYRFHSPVSQSISLNVTVQNGQLPYIYKIDWGDGNDQSVHIDDDVTSFRHTYKKPGLRAGTIEVTDATGKTLKNFFSVSVDNVNPTTNIWRIASVAAIAATILILVPQTGLLEYLGSRLIRVAKYFKGLGP